MANKRNKHIVHLHPKEDIDLSLNHPAFIKMAEHLGAKFAEKYYAEQIQQKNESIREDGRHE